MCTPPEIENKADNPEGVTRRLPFDDGGLDFTATLTEFQKWLKRATDEFIHTHLLSNPDDYHVEEDKTDEP